MSSHEAYQAYLAEKRAKYKRAKEAGGVAPQLSQKRIAAISATLSKLNQDKLNEHIAMPDWDTRITPLLAFCGHANAYRIRALWNLAYGMFLTECESMSVGADAFGATEEGHLCGLHRSPQHVRSIFDRMRLCPDVTNSVSKAFTEYVEWMHPRPFSLVRVPIESKDYREGVTAWWRRPAQKKAKVWRPAPERHAAISYPFVRTIRSTEHQLLLDVHAKLPKGLPHEIRGDLCQDLIVAVLSGETTVENIPDVVMAYARDAKKILPDRWRTVSLDELRFDDEGETRLDVTSSEVVDDHICGAGCGHANHDEEFSFIDAINR